MTITIIAGGTLLDRQGERRLDVAVSDDDGTIVAAAPTLSADDWKGDAAVSMLEAGGCLICPGFVDLNAHVRQPGAEVAEMIDSAARAAAMGGYTAVVAMPDTDPCADSAAVVTEVLALAKSALCEIVPAGALTVDRAGRALAALGDLVDVGVRIFTDECHTVQDPDVLRRAMEYLAGLRDGTGVPAIVAARPDFEALAGGGVMHEGEWSARLGLPGRTPLAEELAVERDLALARLVGLPLHVQQVSTAVTVAKIRAAKAEGQAVSAEVSPHHLVLDESACTGYDPNTKVLPPLRPPADVEAVRAGLLDGTIDAIATGHSPWPADAKERPFDEAPFGVIGLQTALSVVLTELDVGLDAVLPALSWQPAAIAGLSGSHGGPIEVGRAANLAVVDPAVSWTVDGGRLASRSANTPFGGRTLTGRVRHTIQRGRPVVVDAAPIDDHSSQGARR